MIGGGVSDSSVSSITYNMLKSITISFNTLFSFLICLNNYTNFTCQLNYLFSNLFNS